MKKCKYGAKLEYDELCSNEEGLKAETAGGKHRFDRADHFHFKGRKIEEEPSQIDVMKDRLFDGPVSLSTGYLIMAVPRERRGWYIEETPFYHVAENGKIHKVFDAKRALILFKGGTIALEPDWWRVKYEDIPEKEREIIRSQIGNARPEILLLF